MILAYPQVGSVQNTFVPPYYKGTNVFFMITKKQERVLQEIARYIRKNGLPPSIPELQKILGLKSRQPVVNYLARLERAGFIVRPTKSVRSITLTKDGATVVGELLEGKGLPSEKRINRELVNRLKDLDPYLAQCYVSAWMIFDSYEVPNRLSCAAHQMRNIGYLISDKEKPTPKKRIADLANHLQESITSIEQLENLETLLADFESSYRKFNVDAFLKLVDPRGHKNVDFERSAVVRLKELTNTLSNISHDDSRTDEKAVESMMSEYEQVLLLVTKKQESILDSIDRLLASKPKADSTEELGGLISLNPNSRSYFFKNLNIEWLDFLATQNSLPFTFLTPSDELGRTLARLADQDPQLVGEITLQVPIALCQSFFVSNILNVIELFDRATRVLLVDHLIKILKLSDQKHIDWDFLSVFLKKEVVLNDPQLREQIFVNVIERAVENEKHDIMQSDRHGVIEAARALLGAEDQESAMILLSTSLYKHLERQLEERSSSIFSMDLSQNDHLGLNVIDNLIFILVGGAIKLLDTTKPEDRSVIFSKIFYHQIDKGLLMRAKLHITYRFKDDLHSAAIQTLFEVDLNGSILKEWGELLAELYSGFSNDEKRGIEEMINNVRADLPKNRADLERAKRYFWIADKIDLEKIDPEVKQIIQSHDLSPEPMFRSWSGPESPVGVQEIKDMDTPRLVQLLRSYVQEGDGWFSHSREGLGRNLQQALEASAPLHIEIFDTENLSQLDPVYVGYIFMAYEKLVQNDKLNVTQAQVPIPAIKYILENKLDEIRAEDPDDDQADSNSWGFALRRCGYFIQTILQNDVPLDNVSQDIIWGFIEVMAQHLEPTPKYEKEYFKDVRDEMTLSLNSVRGIGLTAAVLFFLYQKRNNGLSSVPAVMQLIIERAAKSESANDAIVIGRYSPWLFHSDKDWFRGVWETLMHSSQDATSAAWKGFLISRLDPEMFELMVSQYKGSINRVITTPKMEEGHFSVSEHQSIPEHMVYATAFNYPQARAMMAEILSRKAKHKNAFLEDYISFFGRAIFQREKGIDDDFDIEYAKQVISQILDSTTSEAVHSAFGWCINKSALPVEWLLDQLIISLERTGGKVEASHIIFKFLKDSVKTNPEKSLDVLSALISGTLRDLWVVSAHKEDIISTLRQAHEIAEKDSNEEMKKMIEKIKDYLLRQGYNEFRF